MGLLGLIVGVLMVATLLMIVSLFVPDFQIDEFGAAITAAGIAALLETGAQLVIALLAAAPSYSAWVAYVLMVVISTVVLAMGITFSPKIRAGLTSTLIVAVVVSAVHSGLIFAIVPLLGGYIALQGPPK